MTLESQTFMTTMKKQVVFTNEDKALLKSNSDWGKEIGSEMAAHQPFCEKLAGQKAYSGV